MKVIAIGAILAALIAPPPSAAQPADVVWREFAERLEVGTELMVRTQDGERFRAVLVGTRPDALLLQPKTRVAVPVQPVPYDEIVSLERRRPGVGAGSADGIGVASGVGAFLGILLIMAAALGD